jgi:hypothetical protein
VDLRPGGDAIARVQEPSARSTEDLEERYDNPLERLQLLGGGDDDAIAAFLDEIDVGQRTATGVPTSTKRYTRSASPTGRRTQPCDAGYDGTSGDWCIAIPPRKYAAYGIQTWNGTDHE